jgi:YbbR domain-containing protein
MITTLSKKIQRLWSKEWVLKFISLCLAALLWYYVGGEDVVEKNIMVSVEVINLPNDLIISNKYKKEIEVTVRGPRSVILEMGKDQSSRQIDLSRATPGTKVEHIENTSVPVRRGVEVLRVQPSTIILSLDNLIKKEIPVKAETTGDVSPGYELIDLKIDPKTITINGPETILSRVDVLKTTPINLQGLFESVQLQIPLELDQRIIDLIGETSVTADITIVYDTVEKVVENVPVNVAPVLNVQEVTPPSVTVTLKIPKLIYRKNMDFSSLFSVTAVPLEEGEVAEKLRVQVTPMSELIVPLEIVSIKPEFVTPITEIKEENIENSTQTNNQKTTE